MLRPGEADLLIQHAPGPMPRRKRRAEPELEAGSPTTILHQRHLADLDPGAQRPATDEPLTTARGTPESQVQAFGLKMISRCT